MCVCVCLCGHWCVCACWRNLRVCMQARPAWNDRFTAPPDKIVKRRSNKWVSLPPRSRVPYCVCSHVCGRSDTGPEHAEKIAKYVMIGSRECWDREHVHTCCVVFRAKEALRATRETQSANTQKRPAKTRACAVYQAGLRDGVRRAGRLRAQPHARRRCRRFH